MGKDIITSYGPVRGITESGVACFFGIPYAAPPTGPLRFAEPQPHARWTEVRDATRHGPTAPQHTRPFPGLDVVAIRVLSRKDEGCFVRDISWASRYFKSNATSIIRSRSQIF